MCSVCWLFHLLLVYCRAHLLQSSRDMHKWCCLTFFKKGSRAARKDSRVVAWGEYSYELGRKLCMPRLPQPWQAWEPAHGDSPSISMQHKANSWRLLPLALLHGCTLWLSPGGRYCGHPIPPRDFSQKGFPEGDFKRSFIAAYLQHIYCWFSAC